MQAAFERYQDERRVEVLRLQSAARNSLEWFEEVGRYLDFDPVQFTYSLLTRSQRISHENLRLRDPGWLAGAEGWFQAQAGGTAGRAPMFAPLRLRGMQLDNRIVVAPVMQYRATDGMPDDWHFTHYAERAKGGAGLVMTETLAVTPEGRMTAGCAGLWTPDQAAAWRRLADFVHAQTPARICAQLGHAGRRSELPGTPLSASPLAWGDGPVPAALDRAGMDRIRDAFVAATHAAAEAGFDMIELMAAHGTLLASFLSPLTNQRTDDYGGSAQNRLRFPLEVLAAMRAAWPEDRPLSVRISAHDWMGDAGITPPDAVAIAAALRDAGADLIDVSSGETVPEARPVWGRMYQAPFSDRIRNELRVPTMTAGNITDADQANAILMAGRADLVALGRPHLADPYWTLHAALGLGDTAAGWPAPYDPGAEQARRLHERQAETIRA